MVTTGIYNYSLDQGSTVSFDVIVQDSGINVNLSGYQASGGIKYTYSSGYLANYTITIEPSNSGVIKVEIPWSGTTGIPVGRMIHEIEVLETGNIKKKYLKGWVDINPEITI